MWCRDTALLLVRGRLWALEKGANSQLLRCNSGPFSVSVSFTLHLRLEVKIRNASLVKMPFLLDFPPGTTLFPMLSPTL